MSRMVVSDCCRPTRPEGWIVTPGSGLIYLFLLIVVFITHLFLNTQLASSPSLFISRSSLESISGGSPIPLLSLAMERVRNGSPVAAVTADAAPRWRRCRSALWLTVVPGKSAAAGVTQRWRIKSVNAGIIGWNSICCSNWTGSEVLSSKLLPLFLLTTPATAKHAKSLLEVQLFSWTLESELRKSVCVPANRPFVMSRGALAPWPQSLLIRRSKTFWSGGSYLW